MLSEWRYERPIILGVVWWSQDHPDQDQRYQRTVEWARTISIATFYCTVKFTQGARVIDRLEFGDGRSRCQKSGEDHEHLFDLEIGMVTRLYQLELKTLKEQITRDMDYKPADQRLESVSLKLKSCPPLAKSIRHKTAAHWCLVTFWICGSFGVCVQRKKNPVVL